ncbi:GNAT family N-acetyltransferase [Piscinibacter sp.]|jgi:putative acetyltransferase|uniref:GNAT family N-acetyltransferase n=1 Tax=Piscinibacter sp. TaxID=1903157 RepID=UPI002F3ED8A2
MTITIRRASPNDAAAYAHLMSDPAVFGGLMQMPYPDEELWRMRLAETCAPGKIDLPLAAELHGDVVGSSGLHPVGPATRRRHAMTLGISVARAAQGRGVGSALMAAMCDYADRWIGALRIELSVYTDNEAAIALYRKFGFEIEGTYRGYAMRDGCYVDAYAMARLHPNPPQISGVAAAT